MTSDHSRKAVFKRTRNLEQRMSSAVGSETLDGHFGGKIAFDLNLLHMRNIIGQIRSAATRKLVIQRPIEWMKG